MSDFPDVKLKAGEDAVDDDEGGERVEVTTSQSLMDSGSSGCADDDGWRKSGGDHFTCSH